MWFCGLWFCCLWVVVTGLEGGEGNPMESCFDPPCFPGSHLFFWPWQRRFFLLDELSGVADDGSTTVVRYARDISFRANIAEDGSTVQLPLLVVTYRDLPLAEFEQTPQPYTFRARYKQFSEEYNLVGCPHSMPTALFCSM